MNRLRSRLETGLGSWPLLAAAWAVHGALLFSLFFSSFLSEKTPPAQALLVAAGLGSLLILEVALLALAVGLVEAGSPRRWQRLLADALRAAAVAALLAVLVSSTLKFMATSVHLKRSDLWFAWLNFRQILGEALVAEAAVLLAVPVLAALVAGLLFAGFGWRRRRGRRLPAAVLGLVFVAAAAGYALSYRSSPAFRQFAGDFVPETHWLHRLGSLPGRARRPAGPVPGTAGGRPIEPYRPGAAAEPRNVVLIMLESIPWRRTSLGGAGRPGATPNLERLASESVVFSRAYAPSTHSDYAQMAILSSLHPRKYNRHDYYVRIEYPRALIWDALRPAGYATALFSCQNERWGNMLSYLHTPGLEVLRHSLDWPRARRRGRGAESKVYEETPVGEWMRWREAGGPEPYFAYLNFQATHFPYEAPPESPRPFAPFEIDFPATYLRYPEDRVEVLLNRFDNAFHYADRWLGEVMEFLVRRGEWERTVLVVLSDHGEAFYEHGVPTHGSSLYEEEVRSLLLVRVPGEEPRRVDAPVSLLDVAPALLEALGLPPHGNFQGRSDILAPDYDAGGRPLFFTIQGLTFADGVLLDGWKYIVDWDRRQRHLFDLRSDPGELQDLAERAGDEAGRLDRALGSFLESQLAYYDERRWEAGYYPPPLP